MKILFQGDSITDAGRNRDPQAAGKHLGTGYPLLIGSELMCDRDDIQVENRAISGSRISDMYGRWIEDTLNIDFDILSILCGINDIGFAVRLGRGSNAERFTFIYDRMLTEAKEARPDSTLVLCEPFLFKMVREEVPGNEDIVDNWEIWNGHMKERRAIVKDLANKHGAIFVPFGEMFEEVCRTSPAKRWSSDGIHTTYAGHMMMARKWLECVRAAGIEL